MCVSFIRLGNVMSSYSHTSYILEGFVNRQVFIQTECFECLSHNGGMLMLINTTAVLLLTKKGGETSKVSEATKENGILYIILIFHLTVDIPGIITFQTGYNDWAVYSPPKHQNAFWVIKFALVWLKKMKKYVLCLISTWHQYTIQSISLCNWDSIKWNYVLIFLWYLI